MQTINATSSNTSVDLDYRFEHALSCSMEVSQSFGLAYSAAKLERQGRRRIRMEVRRSEEEEGGEGIKG